LGEEFGDLVGWGRSGEEKSLTSVASGVAEFVELGGLFDAFGDDSEVEVVADIDDGPDHDVVLVVVGTAEFVDEAAVDLEVVDGETAQVGEG